MRWSEKWQMSFNFDKCKVMHIKSRHSNYEYNMRGKPLRIVTEESDLWVTISCDLKPKKNCKTACKKANTILGFISRNFVCKTPEVMLRGATTPPPYSSFGRSNSLEILLCCLLV